MDLTDDIRENEILALQSIYENDLYLETNSIDKSISGIIKASTIVSNLPLKVTTDKGSCFVQHLPPMFLKFKLGEKYPDECPEFDIIIWWLSDEAIKAIKQQLVRIWEEEKAEVLFIFIDFLQNSLLKFLNMDKNLLISEVNRAGLDHQFIQNTEPSALIKNISDLGLREYNIISIISNWDNYTVKKEFDLSPHACAICFDVKRGSKSISLKKCNHVFCKDCLAGFFQMMIREGMVFSVVCPHDACRLSRRGKKPNDEEICPDPEDIKNLVGEEAFKRYNRLYQKQSNEMDPMITWCPIPTCLGPVKRKNDDEQLCQCPNCGFAFCYYCKRTWHGFQSYCEMPKNNIVAEKYYQAVQGGDDSEVRLMELKYGKKNMRKLYDDLLTKKQFEEWAEGNTQSCPKCTAIIQKSSGCNHMSCPICDNHFCYICGESINKYNPYSHFNDIRSSCHMRLFEGVIDNQDEFVVDPFGWDFI